MNFQELISTFGLYLSTFIVCLVSGFVPFINAEVYLILVSAMAPKQAALPIILLSVAGQMSAKSILYLTGKGLVKLNLARYEKKMGQVMAKFQKWRNKSDLFIFLSALGGFPPFYLVSILAGIFELNFKRFFIWGSAGRLVRFSIVVLFPELLKGLLK